MFNRITRRELPPELKALPVLGRGASAFVFDGLHWDRPDKVMVLRNNMGSITKDWQQSQWETQGNFHQDLFRYFMPKMEKISQREMNAVMKEIPEYVFQELRNIQLIGVQHRPWHSITASNAVEKKLRDLYDKMMADECENHSFCQIIKLVEFLMDYQLVTEQFLTIFDIWTRCNWMKYQGKIVLVDPIHLVKNEK